ncbi:MAG TPA: hypothetical protein DDY79_10690, partial [Brevundimonas sp.]|nr:hypothetical protein [Brevundimonas sp.]
VIPVDDLNARILGRPGSLRDDAYEAEIDRLRRENPGVLDALPTEAMVRQSLDRALTGIRRRADEASTGWTGGAASFVGQTAGAMASDPAQLGVAVATGGWGAGKSLLTRMAAQAGAGAGAAALDVGQRIEDAQYGGPAYTPGEAALDIGFGAAGGAGFEALATGGGAALRAARGRLVRAGDPEARGVGEALDRLMDDEAAIGPAADDFDAAREALATGGPLPRVQPEQGLEDLFANQSSGQVLPSVAVSQRGSPPTPAGVLEAAEYQGRTIYAGRFDPMTVEADAARFQYKAEGDADGVTNRLKGVERWDATASGKAILFEDLDGRMIVADGHQRRGLARRLAEQGWEDAQLDGYLFRARDGWTDREVRVVAALKNIREGSGAIMDAAKLFREAPGAMRDRSLPITGDFIHQARQLASLSDDGFRAVVNKVIPERYAAVIGEQAADRPELHGDLVELIRRGEPKSAEGARALVQEGLLDDFIKSEGRQMDLFGGLPRESTVIARGRIREAVMGALRRDEKLNAALVRNAEAIEAGGNILARSDNERRLAVDRAASELVSRLALRSGEMGEAFAEAAAAVTKGETTPGAAAKGLTARIRAAVAAGEDLDAVRAEVIDPAPPSAQALETAALFDEPAGAGQKAQLAPKPEDAEIEAPGFTFEITETDGRSTFWVRPDQATAEARSLSVADAIFGWVEDGRLRIERSELSPGARGQGLGVAMYERAAKAASDQGLKLASDWEVSADAQRVWSALERRGYDIQRNPNAVEARSEER